MSSSTTTALLGTTDPRRGKYFSYRRSMSMLIVFSMIFLIVTLSTAEYHSLPFRSTQAVLHSGTEGFQAVHFNHGADRGTVPLKIPLSNNSSQLKTRKLRSMIP
ncbi:hypothetical protein O6H91_15G004900 [Diphasiastrum complanatum]|uniref:Uncharacterized protein n=2 Tax=Diphasiastrum complanatum TaxID=34168 RepID=A0ACC2BG79_DIPCM|nr:hypothetical protein O6H91_15G004500 [Diphasiastrum complanatum]KAJ7528459.1 hypothetical protein O6H91_15G004900 [Diphasiastrum complanatum]